MSGDNESMGGSSMNASGNGDYARSEEPTPLLRVALEALADSDFYTRLKEDPQRAAESLGIQLSDMEESYLRTEVHWAIVDAHIDELRQALHMGNRQAAPLW